MIRAVALAGLVLLAGCAQLIPPGPATTPPAPAPGESALYRCTGGRDVQVVYGGDAAVLSFGETTLSMALAPSANGARYVGDGWQWWSKGTREGTLSRVEPPRDGKPIPDLRCMVR